MDCLRGLPIGNTSAAVLQGTDKLSSDTIGHVLLLVAVSVE